MPVIDVRQDLDTLTLTITADFAAPVERIWQVYADPRQLEKVWGPPTCPATVVDHDLSAGGRTTYYMTMPDGEKHAGYWKITSVDEPTSFSFVDGFADRNLNPDPAMPVSVNVFTRGASTGVGHGRDRGSLIGDQPDRRTGCPLNHRVYLRRRSSKQ